MASVRNNQRKQEYKKIQGIDEYESDGENIHHLPVMHFLYNYLSSSSQQFT